MDCMYVVVEGSLAQFVTKEGCCVPDPVTPVLYRYKFVQTTGIIHDSKIGSAHACTPKSFNKSLRDPLILSHRPNAATIPLGPSFVQRNLAICIVTPIPMILKLWAKESVLMEANREEH